MKNIKKFIKIFSLKKLTLFDRILVAVGAGAILLFAYAFFRSASYINVTLKVGQEDVYYTTYTQGIPAWFENYFKKGMVEKNGLGKIEAEVLDVRSYYKKPETISLYLNTKLRVTYNRASNTYTYKGTPVVLGTKLKLYLDNVLVDGLVTKIDGVTDSREKVVITAETKIVDENATYLETSGTKAYLADAVGAGTEIKDLNGDTVIKITGKRVEPAKKVTTNSAGILSIQPDPMRKDVYLTLEITTVKIRGRYFVFDDIPVLVDHPIPLNTETALIYTTVYKIAGMK